MLALTQQSHIYSKDYPYLATPLSAEQVDARREFVASPHLFLEQLCDWLQIGAFTAFLVGSLLNLGYFVFIYPTFSDDLLSLMSRLYLGPAVIAAAAVLLIQPRSTQKRLATEMERVDPVGQADALQLLGVTADGHRLRDALKAQPRPLLKGELSALRSARYYELNPVAYYTD